MIISALHFYLKLNRYMYCISKVYAYLSGMENATIKIAVEEINNNTLFVATDKCVELGLNTLEVSTIIIFHNGGIKEMEWAFDRDQKIQGLQTKWI